MEGKIANFDNSAGSMENRSNRWTNESTAAASADFLERSCRDTVHDVAAIV